MKKTLLLAVLCILLAGRTTHAIEISNYDWDTIFLAPQSQEAVNYNIYYNTRFGYSVAFPNYFAQNGELPANNDGMSFISGDELLLVYAYYNSRPDFPEDLIKEVSGNLFDVKIGDVTLSYYKDEGDRESFTYQATGGIVFTFYLEYPKEQHDKYVDIIEKMKKSVYMPPAG